MKFSTMIPVRYNDGFSVDKTTLDSIYKMFYMRFGGCTVDAVADGFWFDPTKQKLFVDKVRRVTIAVARGSNYSVEEIRKLLRQVGVLLKQECVYFEHNASGQTEIEFLTIDPKEDFYEGS